VPAKDRVCVTSTVRSQTASDNGASVWSARVLLMDVYLSPYNAPVTLQGRGFNTGTAYVAVVRSSDNTVLWQTAVSTSAGANLSVNTPFDSCGQGVLSGGRRSARPRRLMIPCDAILEAPRRP
jgi:hypothetical protein